MTKALKLLYLIDETSYIRTGVPVTWLDYKVWEKGPVAEELYNELRYNQSLNNDGKVVNLEEFIFTKKTDGNNNQFTISIHPKKEFSLAEFSEFEQDLIENIVDKFGSYSANQLIEILHEKNTLWHKYVSNKGLEINFEVYGKKSNHNIDFSELIKDDPIKQLAAKSAFDSMQFHEEIESL